MEAPQVNASLPRSRADETFSLSRDSDPQELAEQFESLFASMLIKEMRNTLSEGLFGGDKSDVLGGLFDLHMGKALSRGTGLGIKEAFLGHITRQLAEAKAAEQQKTPQAISKYVENTHESQG